MATAGEVKVKITGDMRDLQVALRQAGQSTERTANNMERRWQAMGATFARVAAGLGIAMAAGIGLAVREAAGAEEIRSKFNAVFRGIEDDVRDWAETTAEATARSSIALEQYLSTFQDTFVPLGLARAEAAEFSQTLTQLAIDLASFNNESEPETVRALQSALVGNHETVRRYGVIINEAGLEQELLNMGILGGRDAATAAEQAMARLNIIMRGTVDAQGDAARTADSATNEWRAFTAEIRDAAVAIGESFMPAALRILNWAETAVPLIERLGVAMGNVADFATQFGSIPEISMDEQRQSLLDLADLFNPDSGPARSMLFNPESLTADSRFTRLEEQFQDEVRQMLQGLDTENSYPHGQVLTESARREFAANLYDLALFRLFPNGDLPTPPEAPGGGGGGGGGGVSIPTPADDNPFVFPEEWVRGNEAVVRSVEEIKAAYEAMEPVGVEAFTETMFAAREMEETFERIQGGALKNLEDAFVDFVRTGRFEISNFVDYIIEQFARLTFQQYLEGPINSVLSSVIGGIGSAIGIPGVGGGVKAAGGQIRTSQAPVTNVYNIDARYATEGTAEMISRAFQQNTPRIVRQSVDASVSSISQIQSSQRAV